MWKVPYYLSICAEFLVTQIMLTVIAMQTEDL